MLPTVAKRAFTSVEENGSVDLALFAKRTLSLLQKIPGFESINTMFCAQKLRANSAMNFGVSITVIYAYEDAD